MTGGAPGIRDVGALQSAIAQPMATFGGVDLHSTLVEKVATLSFALNGDGSFVRTARRQLRDGTGITTPVSRECWRPRS
jgi:death-on-curing protein